MSGRKIECLGQSVGLEPCFGPNEEVTRELGFNACITCVVPAYREMSNKVEELTRENAVLAERAELDDLTKIFNRGSFEFLLEELMSWDKPFAVLFIDVEKFKKVNDREGHLSGDVMLMRTALFLKEQVRDEDAIVTRFGGDEFCILLADSTVDERRTNQVPFNKRIDVVKNRISAAYPGYPPVAEYNERYEGVDQLGLQVGGAVWDPGMDRDTLLNLADPKHRENI